MVITGPILLTVRVLLGRGRVGDGLRLAVWSGGAAVSDVIHLLGPERTAGIGLLDRLLLLNESWLRSLGRSLVDKCARLIGRTGDWADPLTSLLIGLLSARLRLRLHGAAGFSARLRSLCGGLDARRLLDGRHLVRGAVLRRDDASCRLLRLGWSRLRSGGKGCAGLVVTLLREASAHPLAGSGLLANSRGASG